MAISKRRAAEIQRIKEEILLAAVEIIEKEGYDTLSIRKIATKIQYSPTLIYHYYKDKEHIISSIAREAYETIVTREMEAMAKCAHLPFQEQLKVFMQTFIETAIEKPEKLRAVLRGGVNIFADSEEESEGKNYLSTFLGEGLSQGKVRSLDKNTGTLIIVSLLGYASFITQNNITDPKEQQDIIETACTLLAEGLLVS